jgi:hypothetical protein
MPHARGAQRHLARTLVARIRAHRGSMNHRSLGPSLLRVAGLMLLLQPAACTVGRSVIAPREEAPDAAPPPDDRGDAGDAADDALKDAGADAAGDTGADAAGDTGADAAGDTGADADTDVGIDASADADMDASADADMDASADADMDASADAMAEAGPDAAPTCPAGQLRCGELCVDPLTNPMNCGACERACAGAVNGMGACIAGGCVVVCNTGFLACGAACVDAQSDALNCGRCGNACPAGRACMAGVCMATCEAPNTVCGETCVNLQSDTNHCGMCNARCVAPVGGGTACLAGVCRPVCPGSQIVCGGACVDPQTSVAHCGRCDNACAAPANGAAACVAGACGLGACTAGFGNCDGNAANGCETNTGTSLAHCGLCGNACPTPPNAAAACTAGACGLGSCTGPFRNCDGDTTNGCEANTAANRSHCGRCGNACSTGQECFAGSCACPVGQTLCDGACVNLAANSLHCGACGRACPSGQVCRTGSCQSTCASGATLCGTQCVTLGDNINHCGACGNRCAADQTCASGACVTVATIDPIGCADGTREGFTSRTMFPNIAACSGAWQLQGIFPAIPASPLAACATLGNSSTTAPADGAGCAASNLCAPGWRICNGGDVMPRTRSAGCDAGDYPADSFFAAAVSGTGCATCALRTGTVTGTECSPTSCTAGCRESGDLNNDFFGCGTLGGATVAECDGLTRFSGNNCAALGSPWNCGGDAMESRTVTKSGAAAGGVLCCRD